MKRISFNILKGGIRMSIKRVLIDEFNSELKSLSKMKLGSDEYKTTVDGVTKLADRIIEIEKSENDRTDKADAREIETSLKVRELKSTKRDQMIKNVLTGVNVIGGLAVASWAFVSSINFEKEGTLTTEGGKSALRSLLKFRN